MEGGRATALVVGGGDRTDHLLPDSSGTRLCSGGGDPGRRLRRLVDPRWLADLLQIPEGRASELRGALNPPLPRYGERVHAGGGQLSPGGKGAAGARAILAGSLSGAEDLAAWVVDGHRPVGGQAGSPLGQELSGASQSATGQASAARTPVPVYVSLLSGFGGCDQQLGGARDAHFGDDPQKLGWQPHGKGRPRASDPHQCAMHCPSAGQRRIPVAGGPTAIPATESARHPASGVPGYQRPRRRQRQEYKRAHHGSTLEAL